MARNKTPLQINMEYYPMLGFFQILRLLPLSWAERLCQGVMATLTGFLRKRRKMMDANLAQCFPTFSAKRRQQVARQSISSLAKGLARFPRIPALASEGFDTWVALEGATYLEDGFAAGKGVIGLTAHVGFWELMIVYLHQRFKQVAAVGRTQDNPRLDRLVNSVRACTGASVIPHRSLLKEGVRHLRQNHLVGILIDQNFYKGGLFVDFFGKPAATTHIISLLARRTGCVVLPLHNVWENDRVRIIFEPPVKLSTHTDERIAVAEDTQRMTKIIEGWIRKRPDQWLWLHNRWKRRPQPGDWVHEPISDVNNFTRVV